MSEREADLPSLAQCLLCVMLYLRHTQTMKCIASVIFFFFSHCPIITFFLVLSDTGRWLDNRLETHFPVLLEQSSKYLKGIAYKYK